MAYDSLKALIRQYIKTNGEQEITGQILQNVLVEMVNQYPSTDGFATQSWVTSQGYATTSQLADYLPLTGGTLSGNLAVLNANMSVVTADNSSTSYTTIIRGPGIEAQMMNSGTPIYRMVLDYGGLTFYNNDVAGTTITRSSITSGSFIKSGGTSAQFLKADGSVDSNTYVTSSVLSGYLPLTGGTLHGVLFFADENGQAVRGEIFGDEFGLSIQVAGYGILSIENKIETDNTIKTDGFIKRGGTSAQFLKADGSVDSNTYLTSAALADYLPLTGGNISGNLTVNGTGYFSNTFTVQSIELGHGNEINSLSDGLYNLHLNYRASGNVSICYGGGNCGIGTIDPSYKLDVNGSANATTLYENGTSLSNKYLALTGGTLTGYLFFSSNGINRGEVFGDEYGLNIQVSGQGKLLIENAIEANSTIKTDGFIKNGGTSSQFLKADGSVDSNTYVTASALTGYATQSWVTTQLGNYLPLTGGMIKGSSNDYKVNILPNGISAQYSDLSSDIDTITEISSTGIYFKETEEEFIRIYKYNTQLRIQLEEGNYASLRAGSFIKSGGTSAQFLKADGSVDSNAYITLASVKGNLSVWNNTAMTWGTLTAANGYTIGVHASSSDGGDWGMCYKGGQISMQLDGWYYQNEGRYRVVDTSDLASYNPTSNFKTINNQSIIGTGNINIQGGAKPYDAEVEYLESTGEQWIDTGIKPTNTLSFSCTFDNQNNTGEEDGYGNVFGSRISSNNNEYQLTKYGNGSVSVGTRNSNIGFNTNGIHTVAFDGGTTITVDGTTRNITKGTIQSSIGNIVLFGISQGTSTSATQLQAGKIYKCSFGSVRDFIPVRVGTVGYLYDKVSGQLFGNSGTGSFVLGADVNYLPLTGGTITGNLTVRGILTASDGDLDIWSTGNQGDRGTIFNFKQHQDVYFNSAGEYFFYAALNAPAFNNTSDIRKKNIIGDVPMNLYNVANAPLFKFTWKDEKKFSGQHIGSAAQYWQTVLPELVSIGRDADMTLAMQYDVIALASAITVAKTVVNHEERIILLERENEALKKEIADLKSA